jgi:DNA-binding PucR family transcriptional regulator
LLGTLAPTAIRIDADAYGIDTTREYVAVRGRPAAGSTHHQMERALGFHDAAPDRRGLSTLVDGDVAGFLPGPIGGDLHGTVGVGPSAPIDRLAGSFRLASRALATADSFGLTGVIDMESLGVRPAIATDRDVTDTLERRYLAPLASTASGPEIVATLRTYLACGMHVERAAERLFIHPNTLRYRLSRFEKLTGANLRDAVVVAELWWALEAAALSGSPAKPD